MDVGETDGNQEDERRVEPPSHDRFGGSIPISVESPQTVATANSDRTAYTTTRASQPNTLLAAATPTAVTAPATSGQILAVHSDRETAALGRARLPMGRPCKIAQQMWQGPSDGLVVTKVPRPPGSGTQDCGGANGDVLLCATSSGRDLLEVTEPPR